MTEKHINPETFRISKKELEDRIKAKFNSRYADYDQVVSPRDMVEIDHLEFMTEEFLTGLIRTIPLRGDRSILPYAKSQINTYCRESRGLMLSQRFILEPKLIELIGSFSKSSLFGKFVTKGISDMPPTQIYGTDKDGEKVMGIYLPPLIEQREEGDILLDGTHRSYICRSMGSPIYTIHVKGVEVPYPTIPVRWNECALCSQRPDNSVRYKGLKKEFFRDLNYIGIDA